MKSDVFFVKIQLVIMLLLGVSPRLKWLKEVIQYLISDFVVVGFHIIFQIFVRVGLSVERDRSFMVDLPATRRGDGGLPISKRTGLGNEFVGCNGYLISSDGNTQKEKVANVLGGVGRADQKAHCVFVHTRPCGSGKTRTLLPNLIRCRSGGQRVFIGGPNRVVSRKIHTALEDCPDLRGSSSHETSDALVGERNPAGDKDSVMAHATCLRLARGRFDLKGSLVILDEYHTHKCETVALTKTLVSRAEDLGFQLHLMSATGRMR